VTKVRLASSSYGYGVSASALQVLNAYTAIANGGTLWEPKIVLDGAPAVEVRRVASARTIAKLRAILEGVVERGTGLNARIPGYRVAGKTGTSRRLDPRTKKYSATDYNASFVGFLPAEKPLWTILVVMQAPKGQYYGAEVAAPVFAEVGKALLALKGVPPDEPAALLAKPAAPAQRSALAAASPKPGGRLR
jgi:cell division protein FtsI (penicillin-binding protein 3)